MTTITKKNVEKLITQFTLENLSTERASIKGEGWATIKIDEDFKNKAFEDIADLLGGRKATKDRIKYVIKNNPISAWFAQRIIYNAKGDYWTYCAGQDYPAELAQIRKTLKNY